MNPGISISVHWWRGIGTDPQLDLFWWRYRLGVLTLAIEIKDPFAAHLKLRAAAEQRVEADRSKFGVPLAQAHESENYWRGR
jgi:hypothetical protein